MKKIYLFMLLVLASAAALELEVEGISCRGQILRGSLSNAGSQQAGLIEIQDSYIEVGGAKLCFAPTTQTIAPSGLLELFAVPVAPIPTGSKAKAHINNTLSPTALEKEFTLNFPECDCQIGFNSFEVRYDPPPEGTSRIYATGDFNACTQSTRILVVLVSDNSCLEITELPSLHPFNYVSSNIYSAEIVKKMKVIVYAWEPEGYGYATKERIEFSSFSSIAKPGPQVDPGKDTWISVEINNAGTLSENFQIYVETPTGWPSSATILTKTVNPDETLVENVTVSLPEDFKGLIELPVIITSSRGIMQNITGSVETKKKIEIFPELDVPPAIKVAENFTIDMVITSTSTHPSKMYYYMYAVPATKIKPLIGRIQLDAEDIKQFDLLGEISEACGASEENTELFSVLEEVRAITSYLNDEIQAQPNVNDMNGLQKRLGQMQLKLVSTQAYDQVSRLQGAVQRLIENINAKKDIKKDQENIAFLIQGMEDKIENSEKELFVNCLPTDNFEVRLVFVRVPDMDEYIGKDITKVSIEDVFRVELPRSQLRMMSGKSSSFDVIVYNVGDIKRDFEIRATGLTESWVSGLRTFTIEPGLSKVITLTIRPPRVLSGTFSGDKGLNLIISSKPYAMTKQVDILIGNYGVGLTAPKVDTIKPGVNTTLQITVSNQGEVTDTYKVDVAGEGVTWVTWEPNITVEGKKTGQANITLNPPKSVKGNYFLEVTVSSKDYPEISETTKIKFTVTAEEQEILDQIKTLREKATSLEQQYNKQKAIDLIFNALDEAESDLKYGKTTSAKVNVQRAKDLIVEFESNPPKPTPIWLYALVIIVPVGGYLIATMTHKKQGFAESGYEALKYNMPQTPIPPVIRKR